MLVKWYSIYDDAAKAFMQPFPSSADGLATRMFANLVNDGKSQVSQSPADFTLFFLTDFDDQTGKFQQVDRPVVVCTALSVKRSEQEAANG